jgi:parvulin-like peptidyl-prolyl isomerase
MVAAFEKAAFSTNPGSISAPVQTEFGWHIIQVIAHEEKSLTNEKFTEVKNTAFQTWLTSALETVEVIKTDYWESVVPSDPTLGSQ